MSGAITFSNAINMQTSLNVWDTFYVRDIRGSAWWDSYNIRVYSPFTFHSPITMYSTITMHYQGLSIYNAGLYVGGSITVGNDVNIGGSLSKGSGTFDIQHPLDSSKRLIHSFVEGPRCDLIYRGTCTLSYGEALIDLDYDCVAAGECAMTTGTFVALVANPDVYLQNQSDFDRVRGWVEGSLLRIRCENIESEATISWMVVGERKDPHIKTWDKTNVNGYLMTEYVKSGSFS